MTFVISARRWLLRLAIAAAVAAVVLVYAILRDGFPSGGKAVLAVIGIVAATAPPLVLSALWVALGELIRLPERLQRLPLEARRHGEQLRDLFERARTARGSRFGLGRILWQLTRTTASTRETLTPYAPLLPLVSVPFLAASAVAAFFAAVEILIACVVAILLATG
ncbi:MAG TPA: hypothetical protein VNR59_12320 [Gaiellaceae bacterium]|nr:hypothetical protein [Gaiellaceae bacterium]HWJ45488.1 hypothetical protein [Gaiellaceae bacterium]